MTFRASPVVILAGAARSWESRQENLANTAGALPALWNVTLTQSAPALLMGPRAVTTIQARSPISRAFAVACWAFSLTELALFVSLRASLVSFTLSRDSRT